MSVEFLYFLTLFSVGVSLGIWGMAERGFYNGLDARARRPQTEATQVVVPYGFRSVLNALAAFFSKRWFRIDYFDPERGVIICSNLYSKLDSRYCDVRLTADGPDRTIISVRVGTKFGLFRTKDRQQANKVVLAMLHAALFAAAAEQAMSSAPEEKNTPPD